MHHLDFEIDRHQLSMIALEEMVHKNSYARLVDVFVDSLPMDQLGFQHVNHEKEGRPPYHPKVLLKLYMYGYRHGLRSSAKLHQSCLVNVEMWWLLKGLKPSARTICYFRKNNAIAFKKAFQFFVRMLKEWQLIDGETIAIDSFKIRAQNSSKNNFNQQKIDRHTEYIDSKIKEYEDQLDQADGLEQKAAIEDKIEYNIKKKDNYLKLAEKLSQSGERQISLTDKDARAVILHRNIINIGYNVQAATDSKNKLFINAQTGSVNDTHALADMAIEAKELLKVEKMNTLSDKGYTAGKELARCQENGITPYSSPKDHSSQHNGLYSMIEFTYDHQNDTYTCPQNQILHTNGHIYKKYEHRVKHYKTKACKTCSAVAKCTINKNGRLIERTMNQQALEDNAKRVLANPDYYRKRQQIIEHQFGTLKRQWGFTHTLMKGKENVLSEVYLCFSVYNLIRSLQILGPDDLKRRLKDLRLRFIPKIASCKLILSLPKFRKLFLINPISSKIHFLQVFNLIHYQLY